jgi:hypothetical protein
MQWTNKFNLSLPITSAILNFYNAYEKIGDISVTGLCKPVRIYQLEIRHDDEIVVDYSDFLWVLLGNAIHKVLETADTTNYLPEERLTIRLHGWVISGKPDLFTPEETLDDYKCTSVFSFLLGDKKEWEEQLNLYDLLYRAASFRAKKLRINAILRDHIKTKAMRDPNYPQCGFLIKEIPQWSPEQQENFSSERVKAHQRAEKLADDDLPLCTPEERWHKPDVWAVKKKGGKRALKLFTNPDEADSYLAGAPLPKQCEVEHRPGQDVRCLSYCAVKNWCLYGRSLGEPVGDEAI